MYNNRDRKRPKKRKETTLRCILAIPSRRYAKMLIIIIPRKANTIAMLRVLSDSRNLINDGWLSVSKLCCY
jgi:hypothetical protein